MSKCRLLHVQSGNSERIRKGGIELTVTNERIGLSIERSFTVEALGVLKNTTQRALVIYPELPEAYWVRATGLTQTMPTVSTTGPAPLKGTGTTLLPGESKTLMLPLYHTFVLPHYDGKQRETLTFQVRYDFQKVRSRLVDWSIVVPPSRLSQ